MGKNMEIKMNTLTGSENQKLNYRDIKARAIQIPFPSFSKTIIQERIQRLLER
jgi:hypothetical protein